MASADKVIAEAAERLGFSVRNENPIAYGIREGYPAQIAALRNDSHEIHLAMTVRYWGPNEDGTVQTSLAAAPEMQSAGISASQIRAGKGIATVTRKAGLFGFKTETVLSEFDALLRSVRHLAGPPPSGCAACGTNSQAEMVLINNLVEVLCPPCRERLHQDVAAAQAAYNSLPLNFPLALLTAGALAVLVAVAWAAGVVFLNRMSWLLAMGLGAMIGFGASKAAGRGAVRVQVATGVATICSVLLGQILVAAYLVHQGAAGRAVDWVNFIGQIPQILIGGKFNTLFALVAGGVGATYAIRAAAAPKLDVSVG